MRLVKAGDENLLAAADRNILNKTFREKNLHITVTEDFYGSVRISRDAFKSALQICTVANLVGETVVSEAIEMGFVVPENVLKIAGVPYAQYAKIIS